MMEFEKLLFGGMSTFIDVHFTIEIECLYKRVSHSHTFGLHGMVFVIEELSYIVVVKI